MRARSYSAPRNPTRLRSRPVCNRNLGPVRQQVPRASGRPTRVHGPGITQPGNLVRRKTVSKSNPQKWHRSCDPTQPVPKLRIDVGCEFVRDDYKCPFSSCKRYLIVYIFGGNSSENCLHDYNGGMGNWSPGADLVFVLANHEDHFYAICSCVVYGCCGIDSCQQ
jgi:hypothetical protein